MWWLSCSSASMPVRGSIAHQGGIEKEMKPFTWASKSAQSKLPGKKSWGS